MKPLNIFIAKFGLYILIMEIHGQLHVSFGCKYLKFCNLKWRRAYLAKKEYWSDLWYELRLRMTPWPVYFIDSGMDCDCSQWRRARCFDTGSEALNYIKLSYENAEGPQGWERITKEDYDRFENQSYDLAMEAHENGHDHIVYPH